MPLLDPRYYRLDDLLRRLNPTTEPFGSSGRTVWAIRPRGWGFRGDVFWGEKSLAPFSLTVRSDGEMVEPADALYRPSHLTLNAVGEESRLQVTEDKFITADDVLVSVLSLRNPGDSQIALRIDHAFGIPAGELTDETGGRVWGYREGPPGDDLRFRLNPFAVRTLVFAVGFGSSEDQATRRVWRWRNNLDPVATQRNEYQSWFDTHVPGFDCSDPWFTRLWYHRWFVVRRNGQDEDNPSGAGTFAGIGDDPDFWERLCREQYEDGDFNRPYINPIPRFLHDPLPSAFFSGPGCLWAERLLTRLIGITPMADGSLQIDPQLPPQFWSHFCVENLPYEGRRLTIVWDDPNESEDAYQDGDKGFTIYVEGRRAFHSETLTSVLLDLNRLKLSENDD